MKLNKLFYLTMGLSLTMPFSHAQQNASNTAMIKTQKQHKSCVPSQIETSPDYVALKWYRDSTERVAQYNQTFTLGMEKINAKIKNKKLKSGSWGVVMDIDETVLDNTEYQKRYALACGEFNPQTLYSFMEEEISPATPGAHNFTCGIQKLHGKVILVTNRDGAFDDKIQKSTQENLKKAGICFDNVVFANGSNDSNKTPRFEAVNNGDYSKIISLNKQPKLNIIAYFGDNIQDFPNITQKDGIKQDPNGSYFKKFGQEYFSLPNPVYGSWTHNQFN